MKRLGQRFMIVALLCVIMAVMPAAFAEKTHIHFHSGQDIAWPMSFSSEAFDKSGQTYNHTITQASLGMALSAFRVPDVSLANRGNQIAAFLAELGFQNIRLEEYDVVPTEQTIASSIAAKTFWFESRQVTMLAVAISGSGYQNEWESNFLIGDGMHHEGFNHAAQKVYKRITEYIHLHNLNGPITIWMSGYSRAAAVANRTAAIIEDQRLVDADHLFCYTFATPNVTRQPQAANYPSIFNIVGSFDPVPMIPFEEWGYTRFGTTYFLTSPETDSAYADKAKPVEELYQQITGETYWINPSDNRLIQKLLSALGQTVDGIGDYTARYQHSIIGLWKNQQNPSAMLSLLGDALFGQSSLWNSIGGLSDTIASLLSNAVDEAALQDVGLLKQTWNTTANLGENLLHEHYPKGYLAWVLGYPSLNDIVSENLGYRQLLIGGDVKAAIVAPNGVTACAFEIANGIPLDIHSPLGWSVSMAGNATSVSIPADVPYQLHLTPQTSDPVSFAIQEGHSGSSRLALYQIEPQSLAQNTVYQCALPAAIAAREQAYTLASATQTIPCKRMPGNTGLTNLEMNSDAKKMLLNDLDMLIIIALLVLLELFLMLALFSKSFNRHRHLMKWRKTGTSSVSIAALRPLRPLRLYPQRPQWNALKLLAWALVLAMLGLLAQGAYVAFIWLDEAASIRQTIILWYLLLQSLPLALPPMLSFLPAMLTASYILRWRHVDTHAVKASRFFALCAIPSTVYVVYVLTTDQYESFMDLLLWNAALQMVLLIAIWIVAGLVVMKANKLGAEHAQLVHQMNDSAAME